MLATYSTYCVCVCVLGLASVNLLTRAPGDCDCMNVCIVCMCLRECTHVSTEACTSRFPCSHIRQATKYYHVESAIHDPIHQVLGNFLHASSFFLFISLLKTAEMPTSDTNEHIECVSECLLQSVECPSHREPCFRNYLHQYGN